MNPEILKMLFLSLSLTLILEIIFFFLAGKRNQKDIVLLGMVNVITNPAVVVLFLLMTYHNSRNPFFVMIPLELCAVCVEGYYYKQYGQSLKHP